MTYRFLAPLGIALLGAACSVSATTQTGAATAAGGGQAQSQTTWESYQAHPSPPSVDQHLSDPVLKGAIDLHMHTDPDTFPRQWDAFDAAQIAKDGGLAAILLKNHYGETAGLASLVRKHGPQGIEVFGGLALNLAVGGLNVEAIKYMADVSGRYGRIVWMPTHDSEHEVTYTKAPRPFVRVSQNGRLLPEVLDVLSLIAKDDLTLGTGHVSAEEALMIIREAKQRGVQRIILTHPVLAPQYTYMSRDQLLEATSLGAVVEIVSTNLTGEAADRTRAIETIRLVGPGKAFISSDVGLTGRLNYTDALAQSAKLLRAAGFDDAALRQMFRENPARLIKFTVK